MSFISALGASMVGLAELILGSELKMPRGIGRELVHLLCT